MLWPVADGAAARRRAVDVTPDLLTLERNLRRRLTEVLARGIVVPPDKAALTPTGGVCAVDGARLEFDPFSPRSHRCSVCERRFDDEVHYRAWVGRYHLWLSERAIHAAMLDALRADPELRRVAHEILAAYARIYPTVPNRDNVLGPTRLFFSTYLESIWLLQLTIAARTLAEPVEGFDDLVRGSAALVRSFDEGGSNRQVWHNAAMAAAGSWLKDEELLAWSVDGPHGLRAQLRQAVTSEGCWFEGENYHFFALRGFLLGAEVLRSCDIDLYAEPEAGATLAAMYRAPLATVLPDFTLPARGDAPFGVSLLQPRFAELWEIGRARTGEGQLAEVLVRLYDVALPDAPDEGVSDIAEQERNRAAARVRRDGLGWKALAWMRPETPSAGETAASDARVLDGAGVVVLRAGERAAMLECGGRPGGHGHADILHLSLFDGEHRLADFGTGSYVRPSLYWYRSTLAHNAPGVAGRGQLSRSGRCTAFDRRDGWTWCVAVADGLFGPGTAARRTVIVGPSVLVDGVEVEGPEELLIDLPVHPLSGVTIPTPSRPVDPEPEWDVHSGYGGVVWTGAVDAGDIGGRCGMLPRKGETILVGVMPGPPTLTFADGEPLPFLVRRARGPGGWWQSYALGADGRPAMDVAGDELVVRLGGRTTRFRFHDHAVRIRDGARTVRLGGARRAVGVPVRDGARWTPAASIPCVRLPAVPAPGVWRGVVDSTAVAQLGRESYRRSEATYDETSQPEASVAVFAAGHEVGFAVDVRTPHVKCWSAPGPASPDNEPAEILVDGVQCYLDVGTWRGVVAVPAEDGSVRIREVGTRRIGPAGVRGAWSRTSRGYAIVVTVEVGRSVEPGEQVPVNVVVNTTEAGRVRRAGQLCLADGGGWVYLRGDRESRLRAAVAEVA